MPYVIRPTRRLLAAVAVAAGGLFAAAVPAQAAVTPACVTPQFSQIFLPWSDSAMYTLSPGGSFESGATGWTLSGAATTVAGNESFYVGGLRDRASLTVPSGGTAVSAPMCIDRTYPSFRLFARNLGLSTSELRVDVSWQESGTTRSSRVSLDRKAGFLWAPVRSLRLPTGALSTGRLEPVTFRFTVVGDGGAWQIDDLYVDPYMRR